MYYEFVKSGGCTLRGVKTLTFVKVVRLTMWPIGQKLLDTDFVELENYHCYALDFVHCFLRL